MVGKRILQSAPARRFAAWAAAVYVSFVARTTHWRIEGEPILEDFAAGPPLIVVFWHETLPSMPIFWRAAQARGLQRGAVVLASQHRDGQLIGAAVRNLGIGQIFGSSSRGGAAGLRGLVNALAEGTHVGITPDGPRGPRRVAAPGVAMLAAMSGALILPCAAYIDLAITLKSWDLMRLPLPFGRGALVCGAPLRVNRQDWEASLPVIEAALTAALGTAQALA